MNREERKKLLEEKLYRMKAFDRERCADGYAAGIDEVGRGPLAGPVVAACVVLPADFDVPGIDCLLYTSSTELMRSMWCGLRHFRIRQIRQH